MSESCVLDPVEFIPERVELDLDSLGLAVRAEGVDWGEGAIAAQMVRQAEGESSSDGHRGGVQIRIPIRVMEEGAVSLAEAAHKLQQKVGTWQDRGGWARRDFAEEGGFAGSLGYQIIRHTAALSGLQGWLFAHRQDAPDVVLTAMRMPIGYPTEEREEGPFTSAEGDRHLVFTEQPSSGSAQGLWRSEITNEGEEDWGGLILSRECEDAPGDLEDPTAQPYYSAADLTPIGEAEVKSSGEDVFVAHAALTDSWLAVLGSEIDGVGHMTHRGPRRCWMRIRNFDSEDKIQVRLVSRAPGASHWDESLPILTLPNISGWVMNDLGVLRSQVTGAGLDRLEWKLLARAPEGGQIRILGAYLLSIEQYMVTTTPDQALIADAYSAKSPVTAADNPEDGKVAWVSPGNAVSSNNSYATISIAKFKSLASNFLRASNFGFAIPEDATITGVEVSVERKAASDSGSDWVYDRVVNLIKGGERQSGSGRNRAYGTRWPTGDAAVLYGDSSDLWANTWTPADINDTGFGLDFSCHGQANEDEQTAYVDHIEITVYYTEDESDAVCFASRLVEPRSNSISRQHRTEDEWARLIPDGFYPHAPAGGLEGKPTRTILIPTTGDFATTGDSWKPVSLKAVTYRRDGHHFAREAA